MSTGWTMFDMNGMAPMQIRVVGNTIDVLGPHGAGIVVYGW